MMTTYSKRHTNLELLKNAQAYLKSLLESKAPNSILDVAWSGFYEMYDDLIRRYVVAQGVPRSDVDDCVQEVWSEVAVRLFAFDRPVDRPGLRAWLYSLVRSKATDVFRRSARKPAESLDQKMEVGDEPSDRQPDLVTVQEQQWKQAVLESIISQLRQELTPINSRILEMRLIEHRSVDEVANELELAPEIVHARQHRMMKKLRSRVALYTGGEIGS